MLIHAQFEIELDAPLQFANTITHSHEYDDPPNGKPLPDVFGWHCSETVKVVLDGYRANVTFHIEAVDNPLLRGHQAPGAKRLTVDLYGEVAGENPFSPERANKTEKQFRDWLFGLMSRVLNYFKHERGMPFLRSLNIGHVRSRKWFDEFGDVVHEESDKVIAAHYPGLPGGPYSLGSSAIRPSELVELYNVIQNPTEYTIVDELRAQARDAIHEEKDLLAVLLLAVSTEVAIKRTFFEPDSLAGDALDYFSDKLSVKPTDYIDGIAKSAFGASFKKEYPVDYQNIEYMFRCRNKIAHKARAVYTGPGDVSVPLDKVTLHKWWHSVTLLLSWLRSNAASH